MRVIVFRRGRPLALAQEWNALRVIVLDFARGKCSVEIVDVGRKRLLIISDYIISSGNGTRKVNSVKKYSTVASLFDLICFHQLKCEDAGI